jgi:hypothetical protein
LDEFEAFLSVLEALSDPKYLSQKEFQEMVSFHEEQLLNLGGI